MRTALVTSIRVYKQSNVLFINLKKKTDRITVSLCITQFVVYRIVSDVLNWIKKKDAGEKKE